MNNALNHPKCLLNYKLWEENNKQHISGPSRLLEMASRSGINPTSIHSRIAIDQHTLNRDTGSLELWFFSLEDLSPATHADHMAMNNPNYNIYPFISDAKNPRDVESANFAMIFEQRWHPQFYVKMYQGDLNYRLEPPIKAFSSSEHMSFKKNKWYQIIFTWNHTLDQYKIFVNGVLVATQSQYDRNYYRDQCLDTLYTGDPTLCYSEINFYEDAMSQIQANDLYQRNVTDLDPSYIASLQHTFEGLNRKPFKWTLDPTWQEKLSLSLDNKADLSHFHVQGYTDAPSITDDGLLIETPQVRQHSSTLDLQVYLWSKANFEGDIYIEYEFKSLRHGGLSLLMVHASGMNREDFLLDYPLRTNGSMVTVYGEDVRNYHWEYYREMNDVRNDVASSGLTKNPYLLPLDYGCLDAPLEHEAWHKLQYLQEGNRIIGALDGTVIIDTLDSSTSNSGDVYNFGHIAIRCMVHTKLLVRNLSVYNKQNAFNIL